MKLKRILCVLLALALPLHACGEEARSAGQVLKQLQSGEYEAVRRSLDDAMKAALSEKDLAVSIVERGDEAIEAARELLMSDIEPDPELSRLLDRKSEYRYGFPSLQGLFTKTTVSELKKAAYDDEMEAHMFEEKEPDTYIPSFAGAESTDAAGRGTAYHKVMEILPFEKLFDGDIVEFEDHRITIKK